MVGKTNVAGARLRAVIAVSYPEGSACTCSDGTKTLKAKDTSGKALFNVSAGEWTVTATDGNKTKSATVSITADGQSESVTLSYQLVLFSGGAVVPWRKYDQDSGAVTINSTISFSSLDRYKAAYTENKIDLTEYKTLYCVGTVSSILYPNESREPRICIANAPIFGNQSDYGVAHTKLTTGGTKTFTLDISSFTGKYYVEVWGIAQLSLTDIYLE